MHDAQAQPSPGGPPDGAVWDLTSYFPAFNGPEMLAFKERLSADIASLQQYAAALGPLSPDNAEDWEGVFVRTEDAASRMAHLASYVGNLSAADAQNEDYARETAANSMLGAELEKLDALIVRGVKDADDATFHGFARRERLAGMEYYLSRLRQRSAWTMSVPEEQLAADLGVDGIGAWGRLYDTLTGKLQFSMQWPGGKEERLPISRWRALVADPDYAVRRAAFEGGNAAWTSVEDACGAALNALAGTRLTLYRKRGLDHFMTMALFGSAISRESLDAMYSAIRENINLAREVFRVKAKAQGRSGIGFWEREAPLPSKQERTFSWAEGRDLVGQAFRKVYPALADYYDGFMARGWMESQMRNGKRPGAYCTGSPLTGEQRVYMTFNGSINEVGTVAHELGHAWHSHLLKGFRPARQRYPMTLAETASIFAEQVLAEGYFAGGEASDAEKLTMLDSDLTGSANLLLDIMVRFEFERAFYEERRRGEVPVSRLKELMAEKQREVFGDALEPGGEDPLFWASKLHFYITRVSFYNFPYTVGFLLARALFARLKAEGARFLSRYEDFLRLTAGASVEDTVRESIGADTTDPAFWAESIRSLKPQLDEFSALLGQR